MLSWQQNKAFRYCGVWNLALTRWINITSIAKQYELEKSQPTPEIWEVASQYAVQN